jgi:hypothetical protein
MKFLAFFLFLWVIFSLLDPDSKSGLGSTDLIEPRSETLKKLMFFPHGNFKSNFQAAQINPVVEPQGADSPPPPFYV